MHIQLGHVRPRVDIILDADSPMSTVIPSPDEKPSAEEEAGPCVTTSLLQVPIDARLSRL